MLVVKTTSPDTSPSPAKVQPEKEAPSSNTTSARLRPASPVLRPCSKLLSDLVVHQFAADHRTYDPPLEPPPEIWAIRGPANGRLCPHGPFLGEIHQRQIRRRPWGDPVRAAPNPVPWRQGHRLDQLRERKLPALHELRVERRE